LRLIELVINADETKCMANGRKIDSYLILFFLNITLHCLSCVLASAFYMCNKDWIELEWKIGVCGQTIEPLIARMLQSGSIATSTGSSEKKIRRRIGKENSAFDHLSHIHIWRDKRSFVYRNEDDIVVIGHAQTLFWTQSCSVFNIMYPDSSEREDLLDVTIDREELSYMPRTGRTMEY